MAYKRRFARSRDANLFHGVFADAEAAIASAPNSLPLGYDNPGAAAMYFSRMQHEEYDYPAMLWLERSLRQGMRSIFDIGGHIGIKYYAFSKALDFPSDIDWLVCDVPAVVERGRAAARSRDPLGRLRFTSDYAEANSCDVLFASGALQYLPMELGDWLGRLEMRPRRIILNTTAIHPTRSFYTLNSIGTAFCAYRVSAEPEFVASVLRRGYRERDRWINKGKPLYLPFDEELSLDDYRGYCFDKI